MKRLTYEEVKRYIESFGYKLLSTEYRNNRSKIKVQCPKGHIYEVTFSSFQQGQRCAICQKMKASKKTSKSYEYVKNYIENKGYKLLSDDYKNNKTKLKMMCPKGHEFEMIFNSFQQGYKCPICGKTRKLNYEEVKEYIEKEGYKLLSNEYINNRTKLKIQCPKGHVFKMNFNNFKNGARCPKCYNSKGETKIISILNKNGITFKHQYIFNDCKMRRALPFDFYLPDYNCCIEFDGRQHFEIVEAFGGLDGFIDTKIRDTIKNEYCKNNNIKLIRIPYWEMKNIEEIITRKLINK